MKTKYKNLLLMSSLVLAGFGLFDAKEVSADSLGHVVKSEWLGQNPGAGIPPAMRITPQNSEYNYYQKIGKYKSNSQSGPILFKSLHDGKWTVYSPVATGVMKEWSSVVNPEQTYYNSTSFKDPLFDKNMEYKGDLFNYSKYKNQNVKHQHFTKKNSGRAYRGYVQPAKDKIETGMFAGSKGEFRVMGYSGNGEQVGNPEFPADYFSAKTVAQSRINEYGWDTKPWTRNNSFAGKGTAFDRFNSNSPQYKIKFNAVKRLLAQEPEMGGTSDSNVRYWMNRLSLSNDPSDGSAAYFLGTKNNGEHYNTLTVESTPQLRKNITLAQQTVYDSNGKEIIRFDREGTNPNGKTTKGNGFRKLVSGEVITVKTTMKNNSDKGSPKIQRVKGLVGYGTGNKATNRPVSLNAQSVDKVFNIYKNALNVGTTTTLETKITVPFNDNKLGISGQVDSEMYYKGENYNLTDDSSFMSVAVNNEAGNFSSASIELLDANEKVVSDPIPGEAYKFAYNYKYNSTNGKNASEKVSLAVDYKINRQLPKDSKDATTGRINIKNIKPEHGKIYKFITPTAVVYETGIFDTEAKLTIGNDRPNYNTDTKDDGQVKTFKYTYDLAMKNVMLIPNKESNTDKKTMNYLMKFDVDYAVPSHVKDHAKDVVFSVNVGGTKKTFTEHIKNGSNKNITVEVAVPSTGNNRSVKAVVIANSDKNVYEADYVKNNEGSATATIESVEKVKPYGTTNTKQSWSQLVEQNNWTGKAKTYKGFNNGQTYKFSSYLNSNRADSKFDMNETYKINHVWFKSKLSTDLKEGPKKDGWVDLMKDVGKIKAGYGYELKVDVDYNTDAFSKMPKATANKWVRPNLASPNLPNNIYIQTPDKAIHSVNGDGKTEKTLSYTRKDSTDRSKAEWTFKVAPSETLGVNTLGKFYIDSKVSNGTYNLKVFTPKTSGVLGKMSDENNVVQTSLFDETKDLKIKVMGSSTDDLNDHINQ